jgi:predicted ATPase
LKAKPLERQQKLDRFIIISGCSGGGKSSLLEELKRRGYATIEEPGRRIVAQELASSGQALPWVDAAAFASRAVDMSLADLEVAASYEGLVFFDRGLVDALVALEHATGQPAPRHDVASKFSKCAFMTPPWPEIYVNDGQRRHDFQAATQEYGRLLAAFGSLGYSVELLPKVSVALRADLIIERATKRVAPVASGVRAKL